MSAPIPDPDPAPPNGLAAADLVALAAEIRRQFIGASADAALIAAAGLLNAYATLRGAGIAGNDDEEVLQRTIGDGLSEVAKSIRLAAAREAVREGAP